MNNLNILKEAKSGQFTTTIRNKQLQFLCDIVKHVVTGKIDRKIEKQQEKIVNAAFHHSMQKQHMN